MVDNILIQMDVIEIILKDVDNGEEISLILNKTILLEYEYFQKLFTFGKEATEPKILIRVDDIHIAHDILLSLCNGDNKTSNVCKNYPDWMYKLKTFCMKTFFMLPNDTKQLYGLNVPAEYFPDLLLIYQQVGIDDDKLLRTIKKNFPLDYPIEKLSTDIVKKLLNLSPYLVATVCNKRGVIKIWDIVSNHLIQTIYTDEAVNMMALSCKGKLAYNSGVNDTKIYNAMTGKLETVLKNESDHLVNITSIVFSHDGKWLLLGNKNGVIKCYNADTYKCILSHKIHSDAIQCVIVSFDNKLVASSSNNCIKIWKIEDGTLQNKIKTECPATAIALSPDNKYIAHYTDGWWYITVQCLVDFDQNNGIRKYLSSYSKTCTIDNLFFSADGNFIIAMCYNAIRTWQWKTDSNVKMVHTHSYVDKSAYFVPTESRLVLHPMTNSNPIDKIVVYIANGITKEIHLYNWETFQIVNIIKVKLARKICLSVAGPIHNQVDKKLIDHLLKI